MRRTETVRLVTFLHVSDHRHVSQLRLRNLTVHSKRIRELYVTKCQTRKQIFRNKTSHVKERKFIIPCLGNVRPSVPVLPPTPTIKALPSLRQTFTDFQLNYTPSKTQGDAVITLK